MNKKGGSQNLYPAQDACSFHKLKNYLPLSLQPVFYRFKIDGINFLGLIGGIFNEKGIFIYCWFLSYHNRHSWNLWYTYPRDHVV